MEQLRMNTGKDNERVVQILTDLMKTNKEFQIMKPYRHPALHQHPTLCPGKKRRQTNRP